MPRPPRVQVAGGYFHVFARGVRKEPIFRDDEDRQYFLNLLGVIAVRLGWRVLAYCLMTNHFHLLFQTPVANLSAGMHRQNGAYAQWFNERHGVQGHLFERRFRSILADGEAHLLELLRYVVLNPVRAGICDSPAGWRWSSYGATAGLHPRPHFLAVARVLRLFGSGERAVEGYRRFVLEAPSRTSAIVD